MGQFEFLKRSEVCHSPMKEPKYLRVLIEKEDLEFLRKFAFDEDTVVSEVVRVVIRDFIEQQRFNERIKQNIQN